MPAGWGFDYAFFDTARFDESAESGTFDTEIKKKLNSPTLRFYFDSIYYDSILVSAPQISRSADITAGIANFGVANADQTWNIFISNKFNLGLSCAIGLYFPGILLVKQLYEGTVEEVDFNGAIATLRVKDKMMPMLEKRLGDGQSPLNAYILAYNPADLVWLLLTDSECGQLDDTEGSSNQDIDYTSWSDWKTDCTNENYSLRARFTGQTIQNALQKIASLTNSVFWVDGLGRFKFAMFISPYSGTETFDASDCLKIDLVIKKDKLCNYVGCRYGYYPPTDTWTAIGAKQSTSSQDAWGIRKRIVEDKVVWHNTLVSAETYAQAVIDKYYYPEEIVKIHSTMKGYMVEIGDRIYVTETLKGLSSREYWVEKIDSLNLEDGTVEFEARKV